MSYVFVEIELFLGSNDMKCSVFIFIVYDLYMYSYDIRSLLPISCVIRVSFQVLVAYIMCYYCFFSGPCCLKTSSLKEHRSLRSETRKCAAVLRNTVPSGMKIEMGNG